MRARYEALVAAGELRPDPQQREAAERLQSLQEALERHREPGLLDRLINGNYADLVWKRVTQSLSISYLKTGDPNHEFALYRIAEGGRIPEHTHGGSEMTLVLRGGFADESGEYHPGDFLVREGWDKHTPVALEGEECICLAVLDAPLRFTRLRHRWLNPLLKLRAG